MIKYYKKISFLNIEEFWFDGKIGFWDLFTFKVIYHLKTDKKIFAIQEISHTIELDLQNDKQTIFANFSKANRQQVRKAEEEGVVIETCTDIDAFVNFFNDFAVKKGTFQTSKNRILEKRDYLVISFAKFENNIIAAQSYLVDKELKIVRHYQTANKRFENDLNKNFVGQANKYLLVHNLMKFKEEGYNTFDFGGYAANTTNPSLLGINNYKLKFGGQVKECKDYYSLPYWIVKKIGKLLGSSGTV
jgi:lipid II:glycine glycyltransferase (peptidoglycan interpeptide bridge formation enzyme)